MTTSNPFAQLVAPTKARLPKSASTTVVVAGKRISDVRQIDQEDRRAYQRDVRKAKQAARYQRDRQDPAKMAKRQAWNEAHKDEVRAYKQQWDAKHVDQVRRAKREHQARSYQADPDKHRQRSREYYARNREVILARLAAKAAAKKAAAKGGTA